MNSIRRFVHTFAAMGLLLASVARAEDSTSATLRLSAADMAGLKWETNNDDPPIGDPEHAKRGGVWNDAISDYPETYREYGPNSNGMFANWVKNLMSPFGLVMKHPVTDRFIPVLATHWCIMDDHKTVYFKLDPDARWSDGQPITADDYVFGYKFVMSPLLKDPSMSNQVADYVSGVDKIDDYTIRVNGVHESWRPLDDISMVPIPVHATNLDEGWLDRVNYEHPVVMGPYVISGEKTGDRVELTRIPNWWGDNKRYLAGMYNPDRIVVHVISETDQELDYFKKGELDLIPIMTSRVWATQMNFEALENGWAHRRLEYLDTPQGMFGIGLNLQAPIFQNKEFRKALQYIFHFDLLNQQMMFGAYYRSVSAFEGTPYENKNLKPYGFNPEKAMEYLNKAGYTTRGNDGIRVNAAGERASFTLLYGSKGLERHLTVLKNVYLHAGVEMKLQLLDGGAVFTKMREKATDAFLLSMTANYYPNPYEYLNSKLKNEPQNNNFFNFGTEETDKLIDVYRFDMDADRRKAAMDELDEIIQDEAFYIPFWSSSSMRFLYWDYVQFPATYFPKRADQIRAFPVFWIDSEKQAQLQKDIKAGKKYQKDPMVEVDPWNVKPAAAK
ncbi:extracellular solute-binding protein [soil metagenome]